MINTDEIDNALAAHVNWKKRLQEAVITGKSDYMIHDVKKDDMCPFGKWLFNLSEMEKDFPEFEKIMNLHAQFHAAASEILELAIAGKKEEAGKALQFGGRFGQISGRLIVALQKWRNNLTV